MEKDICSFCQKEIDLKNDKFWKGNHKDTDEEFIWCQECMSRKHSEISKWLT